MIAVFIFYSKASGVQSRLAFSDEFKHCNVLTYDGSDWIVLDFDKTGLMTRRIKATDGRLLIKNLRVIPEVSAIVTTFVEPRHIFGWRPFWVRSCNEICRYTAGIDINFTFNPVHLYYKLLKYRRKRNYKLLSHWRRVDGLARQRRAKCGVRLGECSIEAESS